MTKFTGTIEDFNKFIGGYTRNTIQNITRKYKKDIGKCEHCGSRTKKLEAAHIKGKERPTIVSNILQNYIEENTIDIDLHTFEEQYLLCHTPIEETIKVLCKKCHVEYDNTEGIPRKKGDKQIEDYLKNMKMNKKEAISLFLKKGFDLDNSNTVFSNINKSKSVYWLEPHNEKFENLFYIILNDSILNKLHLFEIEKKQINTPTELFEQRNDRNYSKLIIEYSENSFKDKGGYDLKNHLKDTINYN